MCVCVKSHRCEIAKLPCAALLSSILENEYADRCLTTVSLGLAKVQISTFQ